MPFPVGEADIAAAEHELGVRLPAALRQRLSTDNGGEVEAGDDVFSLFTVLDHTDRTRLARTSAANIVRENALAHEWPDFPDNGVAIAENGGGDYLVLLRDGDGLGDQAHVWDHETGDLHSVGPIGHLIDA
jgi:hypothetical protein